MHEKNASLFYLCFASFEYNAALLREDRGAEESQDIQAHQEEWLVSLHSSNHPSIVNYLHICYDCLLSF